MAVIELLSHNNRDKHTHTHLFGGVVRGTGDHGQPPQVVEGARTTDRDGGPRHGLG